jgi:hypothetical protein
MKLTPLKVSMLIELHCSPDFAKTFPHLDFPAQQGALKEFVCNDLLMIPEYKLTERGEALIKKILDTPLPKLTWV